MNSVMIASTKNENIVIKVFLMGSFVSFLGRLCVHSNLFWLVVFRTGGFDRPTRATASETRCEYIPVRSSPTSLLAKVSEAVTRIVLSLSASLEVLSILSLDGVQWESALRYLE